MGSSSITGDETIGFFDNMSFDGTDRGGKMTTDGELWIGSTAAPHVVKGSLTAGSGVTITNGPGTIEIAATGGFTAFPWIEVTTPSANMAANTGYLSNNAGGVTLLMPASILRGQIIRVAGKGPAGWTITQNAGQRIHYGTVDTTVGVTGSLASTNTYDCVEIVCTAQNFEFTVISSIGNIMVT